ncbi:LLM class flavin-dependent oxidoreductase [Pseudorhodoplanes sp.]|uniref:LLM class flavin-dependent oxidoreductase n=1 Tax=Pseudorhodoplanes sp. TaxID=1934341 RepID=UPI002C29FD44|nr:LLM class flavin-dependent oxidoreductase [Pseudorhodoplanes sp.]HWV40684.1 LLM class flavin-dependent oxidoreductase [Pseudorhodoplanes sp.]
MRVFYFTEQSYPDAWSLPDQSLRITLANRNCDPHFAHGLYRRYHDEWVEADRLGYDIMINEHHSTPTCLSVSSNISLAILARITSRARLLALGVPLANRTDPLRVAEELSMIDVISGGRLEMGFVRGVPYEASAAVNSPIRMMERLWEAHDLILKAMTTHDGPFPFEGEFFNYRNVNIWPRPMQQPHPPVWITSSSARSMAETAKRGYVAATFLSGYATKALFDAYREAWRGYHGTEAPANRLAYLGMCAIGETEAEARRRAVHCVSTIASNSRVAPAFRNPPGYLSVADNVRIMKSGSTQRPSATKSGHPVLLSTATLDELIDAGVIFCGTPEQVLEQVGDFRHGVGAFSNLLLMMQCAGLSHEETMSSLNLFAEGVMPRLREAQSPSPLARHVAQRLPAASEA